MNHYISRYAKNDTSFHRTDPFKYATWGEERQEENITLIVSSAVGFLAVLAVLIFI